MARLARILVVLAMASAMSLGGPNGVDAATPPPNDDFASAIPLDVAALPDEPLTVDIGAATFETGERMPCADAGSTAPTVWYTYTNPSANTGAVEVVTTGAKVSAFHLPTGSGGVGDLSAGYCKNASSLVIPWFAGRVDFIQIAGDGSGDMITVQFRWVPRPSNDDLANARWMYLGEDVTVDTRTASLEREGTSLKPYEWPGSCTRVIGRSTWYAFIAQQTGTAVIDPSGSSFGDVTLAAWNGNPIYGSRLGCAASGTRLAFHVERNYLYWVQATDAGSGGGLLDLAWSMDWQAPALHLPVEVSQEATGPGGAMVTFDASAVDDVDGPVAVHCYPFSGAMFPVGGRRVSCWAQDAALNFTYGEFWVSVYDSHPPVLQLEDVTAEATGPDGAAVEFSPTALDAVSGAVPVSCGTPSGSTFALGQTSVWCYAFDGSYNFAGGWLVVTVRDTTAPAVSYEDHPEAYALTDQVRIGCSASDAVGVTSSTCTTIAGLAWQLGLGSHAYTATASDAAGNEATASTSFSVVSTYGSVADLTRLWISKAGVARDLVTILDSAAAAEARGNLQAEAGKLAEYRAAMLAQAGKAISQERAALLLSFASAL